MQRNPDHSKDSKLHVVIKRFAELLQDPQRFPIDWIKKVAAKNVDATLANKDYSIQNCAVTLAVYYNRLDVLEWLIDDMGCPVNTRPLDSHPVITAIGAHQLNALSWLHKRNAIKDVAAYCVEACILYNNKPALLFLLEDENFRFSLGKKSLLDRSPLKHNLTTFLLKHNRFDMLLWLLEYKPHTFERDIKDFIIPTLTCLYHYFNQLEPDQLSKLKGYLILAFDNAQMFSTEAANILEKLDETLSSKSLLNTFTIFSQTQETSEDSLSSSPKKMAFTGSRS